MSGLKVRPTPAAFEKPPTGLRPAVGGGRLTVAEVFGVLRGIAEIVVDEDRGLAGQLETFAAFVAGDQVVEARHVG